ncbi:AAA family ATPase, partial [Methylosinus sp. Sm6]|uniref:AAA family ATPase n=1 Tax=Methylosinus sp. Sm6 TaxID=2866948 RepID=UPI001C99DB23
MRILAIRGENLASLAERFEIDFEAKPLRGAGLFAITGETGAGKSTILDALCLALYDAFPRVTAQGVKEGVPDSSGEILSAADPRSILRRGAGRGFAEVDFLGRDGERYRARCDLARARGRATGNLQQRIRSLHRIDAAGAPVAAVSSGVEPVKAKIVELTDLTFEQFRRTVLLAQGDFDAFLRSDSKERADLLEKITGASVYGEISRRVHARAKTALDELLQLRRRRDEVGLLAEEARAALETERREAEDERAALAPEREGALALLRRHEAIAQAEQRLEAAVARRDAAHAALEALNEARDHLRALERAEPLRAPLAQRAAAETALRQAGERNEAARAAAAAAGAALEQATLAEAGAVRASDAAVAMVEAFGPQWSEAERLDAQIATAERETAEAARAAREADAKARETEEKGARVAAELEAAEAERTGAVVALERLAGAEPLHARWSEIERALTDRGKAADALAKGAARLAELDAVAQAAGREIAALDEADRADETQSAALAAQIEQRRSALAEMKEEETSRRRRALDEASRLVARLGAEAQRHARARDDLARAAREVEAAGVAQDNERRALASANAARGLAEARRGEVERLGEIADAAVSEAALALRASLVADAPCPVCGAREHPHAHGSAAADAVIADLRARRDALRREIGELETMIATSNGRLETARQRDADARRRGDEARSEIDGALARYESLRAQWPASMSPAEPSAIEEGAALAALAEAMQREDTVLDDALERARLLRGDIEILRQTFDRLRAAIGDRRRLREAAQTRLAEAREETARLSAARDAATDGLRAVDRTLAPFLPLCDLTTVDLDRNLASAMRRLAKAGEAFRLARERSAQAERSLVELSQRRAGASVEARADSEAATRSAEERQKREAAVAALRAQRAVLLGGEPTASHRARCEERRTAAQQARDAAARRRAAAGAAQAAA